MKERVWITWEKQRRNKTLSAKLDAQLYEFDIRLPFFLRYPVSIGKTISVLLKERPQIIFCQNPSLVLAALALVLSRILNTTLIIDAHNAGLFPLEGRHTILNWMAARICKWTYLTIVSNSELVKHVSALGGRAISIPDPIPDIEAPDTLPQQKGTFNILFICSWSDDEPFREVINAAKHLENDTYIYITGNSKVFEKEYSEKLPVNVILTGYISDDTFAGMLYACDIVMVLTYRENCLLCGAYEGEAVGKPLILSNTNTLKDYFRKGSIYTENDAISIRNAIHLAKQKRPVLEIEIAELRKDHDSEFTELMDSFEDYLGK